MIRVLLGEHQFQIDVERIGIRCLFEPGKCFTRAIELGVDVKVIAEWQGHKDGGKLLLGTYSHVNPVHSHRMAQLLTDEKAPENVISIHG